MIVAVLEVAFLFYFAFYIIEEEKRFAIYLVLCMFIPVFPGLLNLLFHQYLRVNDETVTLCKLFKRKQTINWKDATITQSTKKVNNAVYPSVLISDGAQEINFLAVSDKDFAYLNELCNAAHSKYNHDNLSF